MDKIETANTAVQLKARIQAAKAKTPAQESEFGGMLAGAMNVQANQPVFTQESEPQAGSAESALEQTMAFGASPTAPSGQQQVQDENPVITGQAGSGIAAAAAFMGMAQTIPVQTAEDTAPLNVRPVQAETVQNSQNTAQAALDTSRAASGTGDIISAQTVEQTAPAQTLQQPAPPRMEFDSTQARFDEMLARAAEELTQGKTPVQQQGTIAETQPQATPQTQTADAQQTVPTDIPAEETPTEEAPTRQTATVTPNPQVLKTEARALREIPKTDESVLGLLQVKQPEITTPEPVSKEAAVPVNPVEIPRQAEQIRAQVLKNIETGRMEFEMQLNPRELGKIDVKMILEGGKLAVEVAVANLRSMQVLSRQTESLAASLNLNNTNPVSVNIVYGTSAVGDHLDGGFGLPGDSAAQGQMQDGQTAGQQRAHDGRQNGSGEDERQHESPALQRLLNYAV